jgi:hypothetical protein
MKKLSALLVPLAFVFNVSAVLAQPADILRCAIGAYRLADGRAVDIAPASEGKLRWRQEDGTSGTLAPAADGQGWASSLGRTGRADGKTLRFDCTAGSMDFAGTPGQRIALDVTETRFSVEGAELAGRLILPKGGSPVPIVVLIHGAEPISAREAYSLQRQFPAAGIGAFVYDKRGTGASGGRYTHDYLTLATDAVKAAAEARRLAGRRAGAIGYQAGSQGGWVAPLAAKIAPVDFVIVSFGLAVSPVAAERESLLADARRLGGDALVPPAIEIADAIAATLESSFRDAERHMTPVRAKYGSEPWFSRIGGDFTRFMLTAPIETLRDKGPSLIPNIPLRYDPMPVLRNLDTPQLWVLGAEDRDAAPAETAARLADLARKGRPVTAAIFPGAEHGMSLFETAADGTRVSTRQPAGYFQMMRDFIYRRRIGSVSTYGAVAPPVPKRD